MSLILYRRPRVRVRRRRGRAPPAGTRRRHAIGLVGLVVAVGAAISIDPGQTVAIGDGGLVDDRRTCACSLCSARSSGSGLAVVGLAAGTRRDAPAVTLAILGASALTLGLVDPRAAVLAATAGGLVGVL